MMRKKLFLVILTCILIVAGSAAVLAAANVSPSSANIPQTIPYVDLTVESISLSNAIKVGDRVGAQGIFTITLKNFGNGPSKECDVKLSIAALSGGPAPAEMNGIWRIRSLKQGESIGFPWPNLSNATWAPGQYRLTVEVDNGQVVKETNEQNNIKKFDFNVMHTLSDASQLNPKVMVKPMIDLLELTAPSDSIIWSITETNTIIWQNKSSVKNGTATIQLLKGQQVFRVLTESASLTKGEYDWANAKDIPEGQYRIRVISNANTDIHGTSAEFTLLPFSLPHFPKGGTKQPPV